ncbi:MAG: hydrogenase [Deltaproteobacteria bacterium]|nr:hydrogenase [Deltaproteobacteria bacterium]
MSDGAVMEPILVVLLVTDFLLLGSSRFRTCIKLVSVQGVALGILPALLHGAENSVRAWLLAGGSIVLKGVVFPWLLLRILREAQVRREAQPFVGHSLSILLGVGVLIFSLWVGSTLVLPATAELDTSLLVSAGLATLLIGLFLTISRRTALSQVLGYIVVENGIYTFGVVLVGGVPALVELGVLMDAFVAVFIMSIAAYHISREFEHINVDQLDRLKG